MRARLALWSIEARLTAWLLTGFVLFKPMLLLPVVYLTVCVVLARDTASMRDMVALVSVSILVGLLLRRVLHGAPKPGGEAPHLLDKRLADWPAMEAEVREVARQFGVRKPTRIVVNLLPRSTAHPSGFLASVGQPQWEGVQVPLLCMGVWSVFELRACLAQSMLRIEPPRRLFRLIGLQQAAVRGELYQAALQSIDTRWVRNLTRLAESTGRLVAEWQILADALVDRRIAEAYGTGVTASWIRTSWQAELTGPAFLEQFVEPAANRGALLELVRGYSLFHQQTEPQWEEAQMRARGNERGYTLERLRVEALEMVESGAEVSGGRAASDLIPAGLEIEAARELLNLPEHTLRETAWDDYVEQVLLPWMKEDLARNAHLLGEAAVENLPELAANSRTLAKDYRPAQNLTLDSVQREAMVPDLLTSVMVIGLRARGWALEFDFARGLRLRRGSNAIEVRDTVDQLLDGTLSGEEFLARVRIGDSISDSK